jgi:hypothetical protein
MATPEQLQAEIDRLRAENEKLRAIYDRVVRLEISKKGGVTLHGVGQTPLTLYVEQWEKILAMAPEIKTFMKENRALLKSMVPPKHPSREAEPASRSQPGSIERPYHGGLPGLGKRH